MQGWCLQARLLSRGKFPSFPFSDPSFPATRHSSSYRTTSWSLRCRELPRFKLLHGTIRAQASNVGAGSYEGDTGNENRKKFSEDSSGENLSEPAKPYTRIPLQVSVAGVILGCALAFYAFLKGGPSSLLTAISKTGFTAAFTLIFVSEIGDKTFFIAALLAMQYGKGLVLMGSMGALSLMTILSVVIGRIFHSVPAQFRTTLPIGEYAAVALLMFFGFNSIKNAWELPSTVVKNREDSRELGELVEAEELVKEKEWGDRSMLATIALGAAQSPWGVASGAIAGHLVATTVAILGGSFLANYISEKLVGYLGGVLFLLFALATLLGVF